MTNLQQMVEELAQKAKKQQQDKRVDVMIEITSALFDKAIAYTNIIIIAGYIAFFTIWGNMKDTMEKNEMLISALAISFSLVVFVFWEVTKMIIHAHISRGLMRVINAPPQEFEERLQEQQKAEQQLNIRILRAWYPILVLTVVPALVGAGVLLWSFGRQLFGLS